MRPWTPLLLIAWLAASCSSAPPATPDAGAGNSRSCASVADCFAVYEGPVACCVSCPNTAIRQDAVAGYMSDFFANATATCGSVPPPCAPLPACPDGRVDCVAGICQFDTPPTDAATD